MNQRMPKVLIVEDDQPIRQLYSMKLSSVGYQIAEATDGAEGLELAEEFMPDLILLDLRMPVMTGQEMLKILRETDWGKNMLIIVLTNVSQNEATMDLRLLRVERYIVKAYTTPSQIAKDVSAVLSRHGMVPRQ